MNKFKIISFCMILFFMATPAKGLDISNYGDCSACEGNIHYSAAETWSILGLEGYDLVSKLGKFKGRKLKLDLDGELPIGSKTDPDQGYEIAIFGSSNVIYIKDLRDQSYVQLLTDSLGIEAGREMPDWAPEIYLSASHDLPISLEDSISQAWMKMSMSNIYRYVLDGEPFENWESKMKEKLLMAVEMIDSQK